MQECTSTSLLLKSLLQSGADKGLNRWIIGDLHRSAIFRSLIWVPTMGYSLFLPHGNKFSHVPLRCSSTFAKTWAWNQVMNEVCCIYWRYLWHNPWRLKGIAWEQGCASGAQSAGCMRTAQPHHTECPWARRGGSSSTVRTSLPLQRLKTC